MYKSHTVKTVNLLFWNYSAVLFYKLYTKHFNWEMNFVAISFRAVSTHNQKQDILYLLSTLKGTWIIIDTIKHFVEFPLIFALICQNIIKNTDLDGSYGNQIYHFIIFNKWKKENLYFA